MEHKFVIRKGHHSDVQMISLLLTFWGSLMPYSRDQTTHIDTFLINTCIGVILHTAFLQFPSQICVKMDGKIWYNLKVFLWTWLSLHLDHAFLSASAGLSIPPDPNPFILSHWGRWHLPRVHQRKCTIVIINILAFSAFSDLIWQQKSKMDNLFDFPPSFSILIFLLFFFGNMKVFTCFHPQEKTHWN